jgi:serine protease SohB
MFRNLLARVGLSGPLARVGLYAPLPIVPWVRLSGTIVAGKPGRTPIINLALFNKALTQAFSSPGAKAVALSINSPGGSPVQSSLVYKRLRQLKAKHPGVPLLVFVEDCCASGGYYIAAAGDEIIVDECSLVGSIGVISGGLGFVGL